MKRKFISSIMLMAFLFLMTSCSQCIRMPEPNPVGRSVRVCKVYGQWMAQFYSVHSNSWYLCEPGTCFSKREWQEINKWMKEQNLQ